MRPALRLLLLPLIVFPPLLRAGIHRSPVPQDIPDFTLDATRIHLICETDSSQLRARVYLDGHMRRPGDHLDLVLNEGFQVDRATSGRGPVIVHRQGEALVVELPAPLRADQRFRVTLDYSGSFHDPQRAASPTRKPGASHALAPHLDPSGLVLPRESYWYPRPPWADPQQLAMQLEIPEDWSYSVRLYTEHETTLGPHKRVYRMRSRGQVPRPVGLAAGPYHVQSRDFDGLEVRLLRFRRALAEHPRSEETQVRIEEIVTELTRRLGSPGAGRFDLVELSGSLLREGPTTFLGQGSFAWVENPTGKPTPRETLYTARELARAWFERGVLMPSWERAGLIHFLALVTVRRILGEEVFLDFCRQAGRQYLDESGGAPFPGEHLLPWDPADWEVHGEVPDLASAAGHTVILLLSQLQRIGEARLDQGLRTFMERYRGKEARLAELLALLED